MVALLAAAIAIPAYAAPITALASYGGNLYVGREDGAVEELDPKLNVLATFSRANGDRVSFVAASAFGVAWLSGQGGTIRDKVAPPKLFDETLTIWNQNKSYSALVHPEKPVRRLAWLQGRVVVGYDFGSSFFDGKAIPVAAGSFMPADAAGLAASSSLWIHEQSDGTQLVVFARPYSVRRDPRNQNAPLVSLFSGYQVGAWQWAKLGGFASNSFDAFPEGQLEANEDGRIEGDTKFIVLSDHVGLDDHGVVALEPGNLLDVPMLKANWESKRIPLGKTPGDPLWFGSGGTRAWWWTGSSLIEQDRDTGYSYAYLPWTASVEPKPSCLMATSEGLWIGSKTGLLFLNPYKPDPEDGYAGFVRFPLGGADSPDSTDPTVKKLGDAAFAWRFQGVDKAGPDGGMMIASIFSVLGLQLPENLKELKSAGRPVDGDAKFGDVIFTDSSAAFYLTDGRTVEVRNGKVQNGQIWNISHAVVRRYLP